MEVGVGLTTCFTAKSCSNLMQTLQNKRQAEAEVLHHPNKKNGNTNTISPRHVNDNIRKECSLGRGISKYPYRSNWKKAIEVKVKIVSSVNRAMDQCSKIKKKKNPLKKQHRSYQGQELNHTVKNRSMNSQDDSSDVVVEAKCIQSFLEERIVERVEKEEEEPMAVVEDATREECVRYFLDEVIIERIENEEEEIKTGEEDATSEEESECLIEVEWMKPIVLDDMDEQDMHGLCFDEASFLALMNYKPVIENRRVENHHEICFDEVSFYALMNYNPIQDEVKIKNGTGAISIPGHSHLWKNFTTPIFTINPIINPVPFSNISYSNSITTTNIYPTQILQENHNTPILFFFIGVLSGLVVFLYFILQRTASITEGIPCCSESLTSSTSSTQYPPSMILQQHIQILAPRGPLGIILHPSTIGPMIYCINAKSPMVGILFPGDVILAVETQSTIDWKVSVLTLYIVRSSSRPRLFTILR